MEKRIKAVYDGCVEWRKERWMQEVQDVCYGRTKPLNMLLGKFEDCFNDLSLVRGLKAGLEKSAECYLIVIILIYVRNAELGFPEKCMCYSFKNLLLLRDGRHNDFET